MSGLLSVSGLASGLDIDGIIAKIMEFEARPVTRLQQRIAIQEKTLSGFENFESRLLALQTEFARLSTAIRFREKSAVSSDDEVLTASAGTSASRGTFTLTVEQLAQSHQLISQGFESRTSEIGTGTFSLTVGARNRLDITVDSNNNTLEGLVEAINDADAGATASIINTGDADTPYVLLITGEDTGSDQRILIDANLVGGETPEFGSVATVVEGIKSGTATISSSGNYTGDADGTLVYTVTSGGTVGVDNIVIEYTDGDGLSGSFTVSSDYVPGEEVHVFGGVRLSFSAGTLDVGDSFSTDVVSGSAQAPLDAMFTLGGTNGITIHSSSNTVTDVIEGVTFELHRVSATPVTVTVDNDIATIRTNIQAVIDGYNGFVDMMDELFYYDGDTGERGVLLGDRSSIDMYNEIQNLLASVAEGVDGAFESLGDVGIKLSGKGKLEIDSAALDRALRDDLDSVLQLFATAGRTTDSNIRFLGASDATKAYSVTGIFQQGYAVDITQAAEKAVLVGSQISNPSQSSPVVIDSGNNVLRIQFGSSSTGDLLITEGAYDSGNALAAEIQAKIEASGELPPGSVVVRYIDDGGGLGHFEFSSNEYGSAQTIEVEATSNAIYSVIGHAAGSTAAGKDVEGTINGETATGIGRILTGDDENEYTDGLRLLVTISPDELIAQGSDQGNVLVTKGVGAKMKELLARMTDVKDGDATVHKKVFTEKIDLLEEQVDRLEARLEIRRERLVREFLQLETVLAELQSQQDYLNQSLAALSATTARVTNS